jgi:nitrile hydratase accessory protein
VCRTLERSEKGTVANSLKDLTLMREFTAGQLNFAEPWEARVFALAVSLSKNGGFSWNEFRELLIAEIASADAAEHTDRAHTSYYECCLVAFEKLIVAKGMTNQIEVADRAETIAANPPVPTKAISAGPVKIA